MSNVRRISIAVFAGILLGLVGPVAAGAVTIQTFPVQPGKASEHIPQYIASSPTGELWFTDIAGTPAVRGITTAGSSLGAIDYPAAPPSGDLAFAPNGDLVWASSKSGYAVRSPNGSLDRYARENIVESTAVGFRADGTPRFTAYSAYTLYHYVCSRTENCNSPSYETKGPYTDLTLGADGRLWVMQPQEDLARRLGTDGLSTELSIPLPQGSNPRRAAVGSDGNLWIAAFGNGFTATSNTTNQIIRLTPSGEQTSFMLPPGRGPEDITLGPDGALWFTEWLSNSIGRITTSGEYSSCPLPNAAADPSPFGIATGSDGAIWFTEEEAASIGRLSGGNCGPPPAPPVTPGPVSVVPIVGPGVDKVAPALGALKVSPAALDPKKGAKVTFTLSEPSSVTFTVQRKARGRKVGKSCQAQNRGNAGNKTCSQLVAVGGSIQLKGSIGANSFTFKGKVGGRTLAPGRYVLTGRATDAAGNRSLVVTTPFSIPS